ncbi:MAG TPA: S8 family serine peptidase, partial [Verrucomicrobiae bacterium]|nr:S8 family serine peptidase [Verrucomicrobiae bacterium]
MALVCKMTACCPARRRQLTLQIFGFHSVKLLFIALLVSGYPLPTAEAADRDKGEIILESARIPAQERAAKLKKPDGTESKIAADLDPSLRKLGKTSQDANYYLVRVKGPKVAHVKEQLVMAGGEVIDYTQHYTFVVKMNAPAMEKVQNLDEIEWIGVYKAEHRIAKRLKTKVADIRGKKEKEPEGGLVLDIYLFSVGAMDGIADIVRKNGGEVKAEARNEELPKLRVQVPSGIIDTLSTLSEIKMMHEYIPEVLLNDQATGIMGVQPVWDTHGLTGTNQIIGHADSGLDTGDLRTINADFAGRIVAAFALGRSNNNDWSDFGGHGTHTAGSILGNGSNSAGQYRGVAHEARLVHQSVGDAAGGLGGIPLDFGTLFTQAYTNGARIHSDSWGGGRVGSYGPATYVDQWSWNNGSPRDALVVFAAGNSGPSSNTIDYPGTAKNCLTVGASENNRSTCGNDGDNVSAVASSSSRGPTDEGRIKPDLVAPGTWIASIRTHGDRTVFIDDCEDGPNGWSEEWISGTAATPWTLSTNAGARSGSCSWHYTATGPFQDYLVSPQVHIPADGRAYLFRTKIWKNSVTGTWFPGVGWRTNGGTWVNSSVFYNPTGTNFNDWLTLYSSVPGSFTGKTVQVSLRAYAPGDANSVDVYVDDLAVGTYKTLDDMWGRGLAVMGNGIDTNYALDGGTSMATPLTAGAAALVRQFYQERRGHSTPSAALIKATLINGAAEMTPATPRPNNNEGWGRLNLEYSLFPPAPRAVVFFDQAAGLGEGEQQTYSVDVTDSSEQLRATLVWSDRQGATLQNDLDMTLVRPDSTSTNRSDGANNVEGIDIASPARGNWSVIVEGKTVPYGPQPYALVLSGGLSAAGPTNRTQHRLIYTQGFNSLALPEDWGTQVVNQVGAIKPIISCVTTSASYPSGLPAYEGSYFLEFNSHSCSNNSQARVRQVGAMSSAGFTNIMVEFAWARDSGYSYRNDFVESQWSTNGVTWESVATHYRYSSLGTAWHKVSTALPPGTCNRTNLYLSFLFTSRLGHNCHLDGLRVTGEPLSYRVNFDAAGGTDASPTSIVVTYLAPYGELATTSRAGHTFGGWWTSPDGGGTQVTGESVMTVAADQTLYAKWTANTYVVSFDADGGTDPDPPTVTVTHGATYGALPASARPGYTFGGWWTSPNGEGTQVIPTTQVTITSDQSLYAKWTASSYTVSFDAQGGSTPSPTSTTVTYGGTYGPLATTIRGGYTFGGWW